MPRFLRLSWLGALFLAGCRAGEAVPGATDAAPGGPLSGDAGRGFELLRERGCTSCHASDAVPAEPAPRLERVGARLAPGAIGSALTGSERMPDCLAPLAEKARKQAAHDLRDYLASRGGPFRDEPFRVDAATVERGRQLYHSIGCVACHPPYEEATTLARPLWDFEESFGPAPLRGVDLASRSDALALRGLVLRTSLSELARTLADPLAVHPAGRMPALGLDEREARDVAAYLLYEDRRDHGGASLVHGAGLQLEVFEGSFPEESVDFGALAPVRAETATSFFDGIAHRDDGFAFRFRGFVECPQAGEYRFATRSDDGSTLSIDGRIVVDNDGQHGMEERTGAVQLGAGRHTLEVTYFEHLGDEGLEVSWTPSGGVEEPLPFARLSQLVVDGTGNWISQLGVLDRSAAERGLALYTGLGCASCHEAAPARAAPLAELDPRRGCLAREPEGAAPRYRFAPGEREDLAAAVAARTPPVRSAAERLEHELARLNCGACHARGELTGPSDERRPFFQVDSGLDLGDQGRFPPSLERAGAKLKPAWFHAVLASAGRARPYMKTRMPQFGAANVAALPELFAAADAALRDEREPEFSAEAVEAGRQLAGTKGLGCIQCHDLAGHPSIGIPAVDLAKVHERVHPGWFRELLMDPVAIGMNSRMPSFWVEGRSPVKDVLDGDPARQVGALWTYLSLGSSMPLPHGLVPIEGEYEVEVTDTPVCVGVFMKDVSPRTILVGLPERVHYAFDVQNSRLALAWRGRFFDAAGTWHGRAGQLEKPAGEDVLEFPAAPTLAFLEDPQGAWPTIASTEAAHRVLGWWRDGECRPAFSYEIGGITVGESLAPEVRPGGASLVRRLILTGGDVGRAQLRLALGRRIERVSEDTWLVSGGRDFRVRVSEPHVGFVVESGDGAELRTAILVTGSAMLATEEGRRCEDSSDCEVEYSW